MNDVAEKAPIPAAPAKPDVTWAGDGSFVFDPRKLSQIQASKKYAGARGAWVRGATSIVGFQSFGPGGEGLAHAHANEQWIFVLEGSIEVEIGGVATRATEGCSLYTPPGVLHSVKAHARTGCRFLMIKDSRGDIAA